jgi:glucosylceramidase
MKNAKHLNSRRAFIKISALSLGAGGVCSSFAASKIMWDAPVVVPNPDTTQPRSEIAVWFTNREARFAAGRPIPWQTASQPPSTDSLQLIAANKFQDILRFGGYFSDASCYLINQLHNPLRDQLLHELFRPSEMGLSVNRICIGAADSAATLYSYDEGEDDPELKRFSINHEINPDVFYFSSPGSPPGWMKWKKSMVGTSMSRQYLASYAQYFLKVLQAYAAAGVPVQAITIQNELIPTSMAKCRHARGRRNVRPNSSSNTSARSSRRQVRPRRFGSWTTTLCIGDGSSRNSMSRIFAGTQTRSPGMVTRANPA